MVFSSGAKITADIVEEITTKLIATTTPGSYWTDITVTDPGATTWTTTTKTADNAKRALKYDNGVETPIYLALEVLNTYRYIYAGYYAKGIRVVMSSAWNSTTHTYSGSIQSTLVPFETHNGAVTADLATMLATYYLWVESNGFVVIGKPEPTGDSYQQSFILVVERADTIKKRYTDTYSNFFVYKACNWWASLYGGPDNTTLERDRQILRPFAYQWPDDAARYSTWYNGYGISFPPLPSYYAYKSTGNGKVYYLKPIIHNQANQLAPIFQSELFFLWSEGVGLIDGDIVAIQGQPTKFLCKALDSPDNTTRLTYAIKYLG
jgi:hypothetical protein